MDWESRSISELIQSDGHCLFLPIDHGFSRADAEASGAGQDSPTALPYADGIFVTRGGYVSVSTLVSMCHHPQSIRRRQHGGQRLATRASPLL